jgi:uncharacterized membrane protein
MTGTRILARALLALAYAAAGGMKLTRSKDQLLDAGQAWAEDVPDAAVKAIGAAEILGAAGLALPWPTRIRRFAVPAAAAGLTLLQAGAAVLHVRRGEHRNLPINVVLLTLAAHVALAGHRRA